MYWALELAQTYADFLWVRLIIIANEDIGLADPTVIVLTESLRIQFYLVRKKKCASWRIVLANALIALCRAKKPASLIRSWRRSAIDATPKVGGSKCPTMRWTSILFAESDSAARGIIGPRKAANSTTKLKAWIPTPTEALSLRKRHGKLKQNAAVTQPVRKCVASAKGGSSLRRKSRLNLSRLSRSS